jgi:hypothetical protein
VEFVKDIFCALFHAKIRTTEMYWWKKRHDFIVGKKFIGVES